MITIDDKQRIEKKKKKKKKKKTQHPNVLQKLVLTSE